MTAVKNSLKSFGFPRLIIMAFLLLLIMMMFVLGIPAPLTFSQCIVRVGINMILSLAMVPGIMAGTGMNFALPLGIECGLLAGMISLQYNMTGVGGIFIAMAISVPFSVAAGWVYSQLVNRVKGSEMMVSTYIGFSVVALMCIGWLILPFDNASIVWPIGDGLRTTITLEAWYDRALNNLLAFNVFGVEIPVGLLLVITVFCLLIWLFMRSHLGLMMKAAGSNPNFARSNGVKVDKMRTMATILSTVLGGIGIIIYAQGFGFYQLYNAPLMMAFPAIAAVLIGGATPSRISIFNVVLGTIMFQSMLTIATPVANSLIPEGNLSEVVRTIVSNGIILYALSRMQGGKR
ncbi:MAG: ABC transporter permease [Enterocloster asparagiformis]|nr:ABC transporter permease [Enterocloster asparagiformis]